MSTPTTPTPPPKPPVGAPPPITFANIRGLLRSMQKEIADGLVGATVSSGITDKINNVFKQYLTDVNKLKTGLKPTDVVPLPTFVSKPAGTPVPVV